MAAEHPSPFDRVFDRLSGRNWAQIRGLWMDYLPATAPIAAICPQTAEQVCKPFGIVDQVPLHGELRVSNLPGLRESILGESFLLLAKAIYLLKSVIAQADNGYPSWSGVTSYHSGLFACQAVLRLLGNTMFQTNNKWLLVDVWPGPQKGNVQKSRRYERGSEIQLIRCNKVDQRHWWQLFIALVSDTEISIWDIDVKDQLIELSERVFAHQRNDLIYNVLHWPFNDLSYPTPISFLSRAYPAPISANDFETPTGHFTFMLAITLIKFALAMLEDIQIHNTTFQSINSQFQDLANAPGAEAIKRMGG